MWAATQRLPESLKTLERIRGGFLASGAFVAGNKSDRKIQLSRPTTKTNTGRTTSRPQVRLTNSGFLSLIKRFAEAGRVAMARDDAALRDLWLLRWPMEKPHVYGFAEDVPLHRLHYVGPSCRATAGARLHIEF